MKYSFMLQGQVEADGLKDAEEKIRAGVGFEDVEIVEGPDEMDPIEDEDEETQP